MDDKSIALLQEQITLLVNEERERGRVAIRSALDSSMVDVRTYIDEQRQVCKLFVLANTSVELFCF